MGDMLLHSILHCMRRVCHCEAISFHHTICKPILSLLLTFALLTTGFLFITAQPAQAQLIDEDGDGFFAYAYIDEDGFFFVDEECGGDSDDSNPLINPWMPGFWWEEDCSNGSDDDCDGLVDCNDPDCQVDDDNDGYYALPCGNDCNDNDPAISPGATEVCDDEVDNDCDGLVDCEDPDCVTNPACNKPPDCSGAYPSLTEVWPPNHKMVGVNILGVTDADGDPVAVTITGITQDEPTREKKKDKHCPDGAGVGTSTAQVRAERDGDGNGRVYEVSFKASDGKGGECMGSVNVCVPHDQRPGHVCVDDEQVYDSTVCP